MTTKLTKISLAVVVSLQLLTIGKEAFRSGILGIVLILFVLHALEIGEVRKGLNELKQQLQHKGNT